MAGIYFHIPFCKKACHYCNFHFSTNLKLKNEMVEALLCEVEMQQDYIKDEAIETIYFGGGTPSLLDAGEIEKLIAQVHATYQTDIQECTLEANPDDITKENIIAWKKAGINRLSIGVQSFHQEDLEYMNRAHDAKQAIECIQLAQENGITNLSIDLIFGFPGLSDEKWVQNMQQVIALNISHVSCYAMTIEPQTALDNFIKKGLSLPLDHEQSARQYELLMDFLTQHQFEHYEISSFSKQGFRALHNSNYWNRKNYIGIGPSAHSYNGVSRQWNMANNSLYIKAIQDRLKPFEKETLSARQLLNEYMMVRLRISEGIDIKEIEPLMNDEECDQFIKITNKYIAEGMMMSTANNICLTPKGKLFADAITADLFFDA